MARTSTAKPETSNARWRPFGAAPGYKQARATRVFPKDEWPIRKSRQLSDNRELGSASITQIRSELPVPCQKGLSPRSARRTRRSLLYKKALGSRYNT